MKLPRLGEFKVLTLRETAPDMTVDCDEQAAVYWREHIATDPRFVPEVETLVVLCLSTRRKILGHNIVSTGTLDTCLMHPREVFKPAIVASASAIIVMHNHPSGDSTPSEADIHATRQLIRAGELLKIDLLDHVIMGAKHFSLRVGGYFYT